LQECMLFLKRLKSPAKGWKFDLPTEAQWEYACRAGANTVNAKRPVKLAWLSVNRTGTLQPAGIGPSNAWSIRDVNGNLSEWCSDVIFKENTNAKAKQRTRTGIPGMQRGSSFLSVNRTGFRIVLVREETTPAEPAAAAGDTRLSGL
jgi:formylglycine-generating enzyme required for sulfatase activity